MKSVWVPVEQGGVSERSRFLLFQGSETSRRSDGQAGTVREGLE